MFENFEKKKPGIMVHAETRFKWLVGANYAMVVTEGRKEGGKKSVGHIAKSKSLTNFS